MGTDRVPLQSFRTDRSGHVRHGIHHQAANLSRLLWRSPPGLFLPLGGPSPRQIPPQVVPSRTVHADTIGRAFCGLLTRPGYYTVKANSGLHGRRYHNALTFSLPRFPLVQDVTPLFLMADFHLASLFPRDSFKVHFFRFWAKSNFSCDSR